MVMEYGIIFLKKKCVQCHSCEIACKVWRKVEQGIYFRTIKNTWHGIYPDIKSYSDSTACMHCVDPACMLSCPEKAIIKRDTDGIVAVDKDICTGCRMCLDACPFNVPQFGADGRMQKCDLCFNEINFESEIPPCVATCPTNALQFVKMSREEKKSVEQSVLSGW
jgi:anaerobic dimethyl sulfoxide reductase subunit B (iron-sulfur subunit)